MILDTSYSQRTKAHTLPSRTSRHTSQNLAKSVLFPTQKEIQFFFSLPLEKIKTPHTQTDTTNIVNLNKFNGLQTRRTEHQLPTAVLRNGGFSGKLKCSFSNQHLWWVDSEVLRNPPLRKAAKRYAQL
ncbi:hypothetical protein [Cecembia rubra]|uniref:hypothetical protein n=1 Tax=Cecembia rubra TaxID=1485585 RepID=UPI000D0E1543|nr:hypothetical protein [Cecembia rubra]